jgi:hypothetical protein
MFACKALSVASAFETHHFLLFVGDGGVGLLDCITSNKKKKINQQYAIARIWLSARTLERICLLARMCM